MTIRLACLTAALTVAFAVLPALVAQAQNNDASYCRALAEKYETYVANMAYGRSPMPESPDIRIAIDQCSKGNTTAGIPVLEQKLRNARIDLPPRG